MATLSVVFESWFSPLGLGVGPGVKITTLRPTLRTAFPPRRAQSL